MFSRNKTFISVPKILFLTCILSFSNAQSQSYEDAYFDLFSGNYTTALENFLPLAEQGDHRAEFIVGLIYEDGLSVGKDPRKAMQYFTRSAKSGNHFAKVKVASLIRKRATNDEDLSLAVSILEEAADLGSSEALLRKSALSRIFPYVC